MLSFKKLNEISGFDKDNLINAKQNNYAWSMAEFGDYIYVGTGRNLPQYVVNLIKLDVKMPLLISTIEQNNNPEIWRYKKDGTEDWKKVFKTTDSDNVMGFRFMTVHTAENSSPALYAATVSPDDTGVIVYKTTDGSNWTNVGVLKGNTSRAMISYKGNLYVATIDSTNDGTQKFLLYKSKDPEFFEFELAVDFNDPSYIREKNPAAPVSDIAEFNNKLYVAVGGSEGFELWRTEGETPKLNEWKIVGDKGFGDKMNQASLAIGVFKDHLYVSAMKEFPLIILLPLGAELIRIDKNDNWEIVVGGDAIEPTDTQIGKRGKAISGYSGGFSNPFNVYLWQAKPYKDNLIVTTFDNGSNIEAIRDIALLNKDILVEKVGETIFNLLIKVYDKVLALLKKVEYPRGFDIYMSNDGVNFNAVSLDGLGNGNNYGGRMVLEDSEGNLYVGTANPYDGCEVFKNVIVDPRNYGFSFGASPKSDLKDYQNLFLKVEEEYNEILKYFTAGEDK